MGSKQFEPNHIVFDKVISYVLAYNICLKCGWKQEENRLDFCPVCDQNLIIDKWSDHINE